MLAQKTIAKEIQEPPPVRAAVVLIHFFLAFIFLIVPTADARDWNPAFQKLCQNDKQCSMLLVSAQPGRSTKKKKWRMPSLNTLQGLCQRKEIIKAAADDFSFPEKTIAACLLAERTFLVDFLDHLVDLAASYGRGLSRDPSLGYAQIRISTAREIHSSIYGPYLGSSTGAHLSDQQLAANLLDDSLALKYVSALLSQYESTYRRENLRHDTGVLCTLYLVGGHEKRALQHARNRTQPKANFYGFFAHMHEDLADQVLHSDCNKNSIKDIVQKHRRSFTPPKQPQR